jgi:subtilisin family serine protease
MDELDADFVRVVRDFSENNQFTRVMLDSLFDRFFAWGRQAVAAAGNDGRKDDNPRVQARYPAALKSVEGVGAFPIKPEKVGAKKRKYRPTMFSNLSEGPDSRGVVTKGVVTLGGEEGEGNGVLGLYIGEFPSCCRNESKWAWWAGTSFATPILTGALASVLSRTGNRVTTTQDAIRMLYKPGVRIILDGQADKQEDALLVTQS